jgi:hypothetical protein
MKFVVRLKENKRPDMKMLTFAGDVFIWWRVGKGIEQKLNHWNPFIMEYGHNSDHKDFKEPRHSFQNKS